MCRCMHVCTCAHTRVHTHTYTLVGDIKLKRVAEYKIHTQKPIMFVYTIHEQLKKNKASNHIHNSAYIIKDVSSSKFTKEVWMLYTENHKIT